LIFGSVFSMALATAVYFKIMSSGEASKVGSFTFLVPLIAVGIGRYSWVNLFHSAPRRNGSYLAKDLLD
jgi:drug/metabolite transporter (DMT)-like permease